jgi:hypothetical protein
MCAFYGEPERKGGEKYMSFSISISVCSGPQGEATGEEKGEEKQGKGRLTFS